jgi:lipopolysaccharide/colanic/teichoic acid biosynthesis glycosyltransferase
VPAVLFTNKNSKEKSLKWWGYYIEETINKQNIGDWLKSISNNSGRINKYKLILIDVSEEQSEFETTTIPQKYFADFIGIKSYKFFRYLLGFHVLRFSRYPGRGVEYRVKRLIDYSICLTALLISAPLFIFIIICIKLDSPGPVFYRHRRLGKNMRPFDLLKLRTMYEDADKRLEHILSSNKILKEEYQKTFKLKKDPRITRTGKIIRQLSMDELPQILNVIYGDMSLVGPRPIVEKEIPYYESYSLDLFRVLPGVSGLWQTSGRTETTYEKRVRLDTQYVRSWSLLTDLKLLIKTIPAVLSQRGAY